MRTTDCKNLRREIDGATPGRLRSAFANRHISDCGECRSFSEETVKLQELLSGLGTVEAPGDFDFRLRARLAGEKPARAHFPLSGLSFGLRSAVVASLLLVCGLALFLGLKSSPNSSLTANQVTPQPQVKPSGDALQSTAPTTVESTTLATDKAVHVPRKGGIRSSALAASRANSISGTRDLASRPATIIKAADLVADFPIEASTQPVKVSLDNGRGNSRTISLPPVSFGSQRVMSQGTSPYVASARGSW